MQSGCTQVIAFTWIQKIENSTSYPGAKKSKHDITIVIKRRLQWPVRPGVKNYFFIFQVKHLKIYLTKSTCVSITKCLGNLNDSIYRVLYAANNYRWNFTIKKSDYDCEQKWTSRRRKNAENVFECRLISLFHNTFLSRAELPIDFLIRNLTSSCHVHFSQKPAAKL